MVARLQKVLADRGVASRRRAEELISEGRVRVDGEIVTTLGTRVPESAHIEVDGRRVAAAPTHRYVMLNKPAGVVSTAQDDRGRPTVVDLIGAAERLYPVGRLDEDSQGLLVLTNDGTFADRLLHPRYGHEREYDVDVQGDLSDETISTLRKGIPLEEGLARAARVSVRSRSRARSRMTLVLHTGWKRQVRRMCAAVGLKVTRLTRVRMGPLVLGRLRQGQWRELTTREIAALMTEGGAARAPRVTRRDTFSRARVEGTPPSRQRYATRRAGRPTREREVRAAAGPAAHAKRAAAGPAARAWQPRTRTRPSVARRGRA